MSDRTTCNWSLEQAQIDFLAFVSGIPSRYRRGSLKHRALADVCPQPIPTIVLRLAGRAPQAIRPFIESVFIGVPTSRQIDAAARAFGANSRVAWVTRPLYRLTLSFSAVFMSFEKEYRDFLAPRLAAKPKQIVEFSEGLGLMEKYVDEFLVERPIQSLAPSSAEAMLLRELVLSSPFETMPVDFVLPEYEQQVVSSLSDQALIFIIAHEISHHLLDHTIFPTEGISCGRSYFDAWLAEIGATLPVAANESQLHEYEADAFAAKQMLVSHDKEHNAMSILPAVGASAIALAALAVTSGLGGDRCREINASEDPRETHPGFRDRVKFLLELFTMSTLLSAPVIVQIEQLRREVSLHATQFALQIWACAAYLDRLISEGDSNAHSPL